MQLNIVYEGRKYAGFTEDQLREAGIPEADIDNAKWDLKRGKRDKLLAKCDWTQMPDAPLTIEKKQEWATYRQALRDITTTYAQSEDAAFPTVPE